MMWNAKKMASKMLYAMLTASVTLIAWAINLAHTLRCASRRAVHLAHTLLHERNDARARRLCSAPIRVSTASAAA
jgi:hypothetical protein